MLDPFSAAAFNMTAAENPGLLAQLLGRMGIPPPNMQAPSMLGGPTTGQLLSPNALVSATNDPAYWGPQTADAAPTQGLPVPPISDGTPAGAAGTAASSAPGGMQGMAALGRALLGSKAGSTDVKPQFSGGITGAGKVDGVSGKVPTGQAASLQLIQQLLTPRPLVNSMPTLGALLGGR